MTWFTHPNWRWFSAFCVAMVMLIAFTTLRTVLDLRTTVGTTNNQLQCVLYELNAHRIENAADAAAADGESGAVRDEPETLPSLTLPDKLRESCETILPGSTER